MNIYSYKQSVQRERGHKVCERATFAKNRGTLIANDNLAKITPQNRKEHKQTKKY